MQEIIISSLEENQRLDKFLLRHFNNASKAFIYKMLRKKRIKYNGQRGLGGEIIQKGDKITFYLSQETMDRFITKKEIPEVQRHFGILYEDENILIVDKPAGLLCHPIKPGIKDTLIDQILFYLYEKDATRSFTPAICNRIDRNTPGIVVAGKNLASVQGLNKAFKEKSVHKYYTALVQGKITQEGVLQGFHNKDARRNRAAIKGSGVGKEVETRYTPIAYNENYTLLLVQIITGKSHQIRAHLQSAGHPIVGDRKYGDEKINKLFKQKYGLCNQYLHAGQISFIKLDPFLCYLNGKEFYSPYPYLFDKIKRDVFQPQEPV